MRGSDSVERQRRAEAVRLLDRVVGGAVGQVITVVEQYLAVLEPPVSSCCY